MYNDGTTQHRIRCFLYMHEPLNQSEDENLVEPGIPTESSDDARQDSESVSQSEDSDMSMADLLAEVGEESFVPKRGEIVAGTVVSIDRENISVDIGTKVEGVVHHREVGPLVERGELSVGDKVMVYVVAPENRSGNPVLSVDRARAKSGWLTMQKHLDAGESLNVQVVDVNRGGLMVDAEGLRGFVPLSQTVGLRSGSNEEETLENLRTAIGREIEVKILELDHRRNRLILSERLATLERRGRRREELLNELHVGDIRKGRVASISDFGAFVDIGGADGLVHLSELAWSQVNHPSDVVKVGDELEVMVINVDQERKRIGLSLRRAQSEPWDTVVERYTVGDVVHGVITKLTKFGAFARLEEGVEGLIHISEMGTAHVEHPRSVVHEGQKVMIRILRIDTERRRIGLSLNQDDEELMSTGMPMSYGPPPSVDAPSVLATPDEPTTVEKAIQDEGASTRADETVGPTERPEDDSSSDAMGTSG